MTRTRIARRTHRTRWVVAVVLATGATLVLAGCTSTASPTARSTAAAVSEPVIAVAGAGHPVSYLEPVRITVSAGTLASMRVTAKGEGQVLDGDVAGDRMSWVSQAPPKPGTSYEVVATATDGAGKTSDQSATFTVASVPDDRRLSFSVTPDGGTTVGIGQPIVVRFTTPVTHQAAVEKVMLVDARTPSGTAVVGNWHWLSASEVHWRPEAFWTPGTKVALNLRLAGVQASAQRYGRKDYAQTFTIGASHVTRVDAVGHRIRVYRDDKLVNTWLSGTGKKGLETYSGTYVVLGKAAVVQMDSCSARITCDKKAADYYDEKEYWATRITASGTFLHAASWDGQLGKANVSHGCIHLSDANAKDFYDHAVRGDVVIVTGSGRGPAERIATQDPGLYDWNLTWSAWQAGSALA